MISLRQITLGLWNRVGLDRQGVKNAKVRGKIHKKQSRNLKKNTALIDLSNTMEDNIKTETGFPGSGKFVVVGFCEHSDGLSRSVEGAEVFDQINDRKRVWNNSISLCYIKPRKINYSVMFVN
jgi:hypothetical protein